MSFFGQSFLDVDLLKPEDVFLLFKKAQVIRSQVADQRTVRSSGISIAMMFFEPSTRTRASFELACEHLAIRTLNFDPMKSSLTKGETIEDTALNIEAMGVNCVVVRHGQSGVLEKLTSCLKIPVISAGDGMRSHPTQALLDAFTIYEERGKIEREKVLIVGDILHSRVARSNFSLLKTMGAELAVCGPSTLIPSYLTELGLRRFERIEDGLRWASVCMLLRMQLERQASFQVPSMRDYHRLYGVTQKRIDLMAQDAILMHPGPINRDVEISGEAMQDSRARILRQVRNGVFIRAALISEILGIKSTLQEE